MEKFIGTGVALVTPFSEGKIDLNSLGSIIDYVITGGVDYIVSLGSTGEAGLLTPQEQRNVLNFTIKHNNGRVPIVAGNFGAVGTAEVCQKIKDYDFTGIDAILSSCPSYVKPTQEGLYQHYSRMAEISPIPIILYNVPGRTAVNMKAETTLRLARDHDNIIGIKEASNDLKECAQISENAPPGFLLISGDDELTLELMKLGGKGVISVVANAFPDIFSQMIQSSLNTDWKNAEYHHQTLLPLHPWLYIEGNPAGIKAAMEHLGMCDREVRLPLVNMSEANYQKLVHRMDMIKSL